MAKALKTAALVVGAAALVVVTAGAAAAIAGGVALSAGIAAVSSAVGLGALGLTVGSLSLIAGGLSVGAQLLTKQPSIPSSQTQRLNASIDPRALRKTALGQTALATDIRYEEWSGKDQEYCDWIICLASHAIDGVEEIWQDQEMLWSATTGVTAKYRGYFSVPRIVLEGSPANAFAFGSGKWNGSARLTGCAYLRLQFKTTGNGKKAESPYAGGISTRLTIIGRGAKLYDPRRDSTVPGGSGPMRWDDQSTWRYTADDGAVIGENLALQILRVVLGWKIRNPITGEMKLATGSGVPGRRIDLVAFQVAANLCDELVNRSAGGTEPRYHGAGVISEGDDPKGTLDALCAACCGRFRDTGGKLALVIAHNDLAAAAADDGLNDHDVIGGFTWDPDPALEATPNVVRGRYVDATTASLYQLLDYPEVRIASPDGQDRIATLDLGLVESPSQAQRIARQVLQRRQYQRSFQAPFDIRAWKYTVGDVVPFTFAPLGFTRALFRVADQELGQDGSCNMTLTVEHQQIYAWDASDAAPVLAADPIIYEKGNNPLILAIGEAATTALWSGVANDDGSKPDPNATNSGDPNSPFGPGGTVGDAINRFEQLDQAIQDVRDGGGSGPGGEVTQAAIDARDAAIVAATNSATARDQSQAARDAAQAAQGQALASAEAAAGAFGTAQAQATIASQKADEAGQQATIASGHATVAATKAGEAVVSASEAATSKSDAAGSASSAATSAGVAASTYSKVIQATGNEQFDNGLDGWIATDGLTVLPNEYGRVNVASTAPGAFVVPQGRRVPVRGDDQRFRLRASWRAAGTGDVMFFMGVIFYDGNDQVVAATDGSGNYPLGLGVTLNSAIHGWLDREVVIGRGVTDAPYGGTPSIPASAVYFRPIMFLNYEGANPNGIAQVDYFTVDDVTTELNAGRFASAAAGSAATAAASENAAGQHASAAETSRTDAQTAAGQASTYRDQASTSATNAASSASTASTQARLAATSALSRGLTPNADFTIGADGWSTDMEWIGDIGDASGVLRDPTGNRVAQVSPPIPVNLTSTYRLRGRFAIRSGGSYSVHYMGVTCYNSAGSALGNVYILSVVGQAIPGSWYEPEGRYKGTLPLAGSGPWFTGGEAFLPGTVSVAPLFLSNRNTDSVVVDLDYLYLEEYTGAADAAAYAQAANTSASTASAKSDEASASASAASSSAQIAEGYSNSASTSAQAAQGSAASADGSKSSAASYADLAAQYRDQAGGSAGAADTSAKAAQASSASANGQAAAAQSSAELAAQYRDQAGGSAGAASGSAEAAQASSAVASGSASAAQNSADLAAGFKNQAVDAAASASSSAEAVTNAAGALAQKVDAVEAKANGASANASSAITAVSDVKTGLAGARVRLLANSVGGYAAFDIWSDNNNGAGWQLTGNGRISGDLTIDGTMTTGKIADGAITTALAAQSLQGATVPWEDASPHYGIQATIPSATGAGVRIDARSLTSSGGNGAGPPFSIQLERVANGVATVISTTVATTGGILLDYPPANTAVTYRFRYGHQYATNSGTSVVIYQQLFVLELKK